jgi:hypothetical protein
MQSRREPFEARDQTLKFYIPSMAGSVKVLIAHVAQGANSVSIGCLRVRTVSQFDFFARQTRSRSCCSYDVARLFAV